MKGSGLIGFDGVVAIDLAGPADAFAVANEAESDPKPSYEVLIIASSSQPFVSGCGLIFKPQRTFKTAPSLDTLIIPGGSALLKPAINRSVSAFINARAGCTRPIDSIYPGIYGLGATGLLSGRKVTPPWHPPHNVARRFPRLK